MRCPHLGADDLRTARHVAVLRSVAHPTPHARDAVGLDEVNDQLELVQHFVVRALRLVAGLHQRLEPGLYQLRHAAAQHRLLAEQIALGLFLEGRFEHPRLGRAQRLRVGERDIHRLAARVLVDGDERRHAAALLIFVPHQRARTLRRHHEDIHVAGRDDLVVVDVEPMGEHESVALLQVRSQRLPVHQWLHVVLSEQCDYIGLLGCLRRRHHRHRVGLGVLPGGRAFQFGGDHFHAAVAQTERMGAALNAVAHDADGLAPQRGQLPISIAVDSCHAIPPRFAFSVSF